jgi:tetratricopeptide (TPR) repeat protein
MDDEALMVLTEKLDRGASAKDVFALFDFEANGQWPALTIALYIRKKMYDAAIRELHRSIAADPPAAARQLNSFAWNVVGSSNATPVVAKTCVPLAKRAVELAPAAGHIWNTLGVAHYRAGNWKEAVAALDNSMELSAGGEALNWFFLAMAHWQLGNKERARKWYTPAILWMHQRQSTDAELRQFRAEAAALLKLPEHPAQAQEQAAPDDVGIYSLVLEANPRATSAYAGRGAAYAALRQWDKAAADFAKASELNAATQPHYASALVRLAANDLAGYRKACAGMLERLGPSPDLDADRWTTWTCVLGPAAVADWGRPLELAQKALADDPKNFDKLLDLGAVLYRAGRLEEAAQRLAEAEAASKGANNPGSIIYNWLFQAMTDYGRGRSQEAKRLLAKAVKDIEQPPPERPLDGTAIPWNRRLTLQLLRREAEALLKEPAAKPKQKPE